MPHCGIEFLESAAEEVFGVGVIFEDGENGGARSGHHGSFGFRLLQKELFEFGEELELFKDGAFEVVNENLVASSLLSVGDFWEFAGFFPSGVSPRGGDAESGFEEEDASIPIESCWFNDLAASTTPAGSLVEEEGNV